MTKKNWGQACDSAISQVRRMTTLACQLRIDPVVQRDALGGGFEGEAAVEVFAHTHVQAAAVGAIAERFGDRLARFG
jgi:hypothetical protein